MDADRPALTQEQDLLARGPLVERLAGWVREAPIDEGFVIGLTGPWGSGKTTILHFLEEALGSDAVVVWFEPWLFSDADQLVTRFFGELSARLKGDDMKRRLRKLGTQLADYGAALSPAASVVLGPAGQIAAAPKQVASLRSVSASGQRRAIRDALRKHPQRIVVLIDDLDRLDPREVGEVLRLVKLVADLPGVVHILGFDRPRVERALDKLGSDDGNAYLQKIVQASMGVPPVGRDQLRSMSMEWLEQALSGHKLEAWVTAAWSGLAVGGIDGYLKTLRDGRRLANMAPAAVDLCSDEVAGMDVLALEAMRIFDPDVHEALPLIADILGGNQGYFEFRKQKDVDKEHREKIEKVLAKSGAREPTTHILRTLFPAAAHLLGGTRTGVDQSCRTLKRVAARPVLMRYLHHTLDPTDAASATVDAALAVLSKADEFEAVLAAIEDARLGDLIDRIRARLGEQSDIDVLGSSLALLGLSHRLIGRPRGVEIDPTQRAIWLVDDLLETAQTDERLTTERSLVTMAPTLSLQVQLLYRYRKRDEDATQNPEVELLDADTFAQLAAQLAEQIASCPAADLLAEQNLLWLLGLVQETSGQAAALERLKEPSILTAVLEQSGTEVRPLTDGGMSLDIQPLVRLAGPDVLEALRALAESPSILAADVHAALTGALRAYAALADEATQANPGGGQSDQGSGG
jgi:hypothetical protein